MNALESVTGFITGLRLDEIPSPVLAEARKAIIDCIGVSLAARREPALSILASFIGNMGGEPRATLWGTRSRTSPVWAALYNGTMAHALDFDDGSGLHIPLHPTAPVLPAVIALGEFFRGSGALLVEAFVAGTEVECKLARGSSRASYDAGWHATGVFGTMGAAAAAAKLAGLDPVQAGNALGAALSHASGSRQNFGTMVKPLHAGSAAMNGVMSALLAGDGFTASGGALDGPFGFGKLFGGKTVLEECGRLGRPFHLASGFSVKKYPSCYSTHSAIDAILEILRTNPVDYREIRAINCWVHPSHVAGLPYRVPVTDLEGKFSMPFVLALACIYHGVELGHFTAGVVHDARIVDLCKKVNFLSEESLPPMGSRVAVVIAGNETYTAATDRPRGHPLNPLTPEEVEHKFRSCAALSLSEEKTAVLLEMLLHIEEMKDIGSLTEAMGDR